MERCFVFQPGMLVRKSCYEKIGQFNEQLIRSQDYDMLLRISHRFEGIGTEHVVYYQRQHDGVRGPDGKKMPASQLEDFWLKYDQIFFRKWYFSLPLENFLPKDHSGFNNENRVTALLQRGTLMGRKRLWDLAAKDYEEALCIAGKINKTSLSTQEKRIVRKLLIENQCAIPTGEDTQPFTQLIERLPENSLAEDVKINLIWAYPYYLKEALQNKNIHLAYEIIKMHASLAGLKSFLAVILKKYLYTG